VFEGKPKKLRFLTFLPFVSSVNFVGFQFVPEVDEVLFHHPDKPRRHFWVVRGSPGGRFAGVGFFAAGFAFVSVFFAAGFLVLAILCSFYLQ
jgi:hypothetical protein